MAETAWSETGFANVNGVRLYYEVAGDGHPLVFVHAGIADSRMWDDQFAVFAEHYRVVRYDMRGFGQSDPVPGEFSFSADLHGLLQHLGIEQAHLIGCSMGGATIIDFALEHPDMVTTLVAVCSGLNGYKYEGPMPEGWDALLVEDEQLEKLIEQGNKEAAAQLGADLDVRLWVDGMYRASNEVDPVVRERVREMAAITYAHADVEAKHVPPEPPAINHLGEIRVPTLVVVGTGDLPSILDIANVLATSIPGARKVEMPVVAHVPNMEQPDEFNRIVLDFLRAL